MEQATKEEIAETQLVCKQILKIVGRVEPHIALNAITTCIASIFLNTGTPLTDEDLLKLFDKRLRRAVRVGRSSQLKGMTQH